MLHSAIHYTLLHCIALHCTALRLQQCRVPKRSGPVLFGSAAGMTFGSIMAGFMAIQQNQRYRKIIWNAIKLSIWNFDRWLTSLSPNKIIFKGFQNHVTCSEIMATWTGEFQTVGFRKRVEVTWVRTGNYGGGEGDLTNIVLCMRFFGDKYGYYKDIRVILGTCRLNLESPAKVGTNNMDLQI